MLLVLGLVVPCALPAKLAEQPAPHERVWVEHGLVVELQLPLGVPQLPLEQLAVAEPL